MLKVWVRFKSVFKNRESLSFALRSFLFAQYPANYAINPRKQSGRLPRRCSAGDRVTQNLRRTSRISWQYKFGLRCELIPQHPAARQMGFPGVAGLVTQA